MDSETPSQMPGYLSGSLRRKTSGRWQTILLAVALPAGLLAVLLLVFKDRLQPSVPVDIEAVLLLEEEGTANAPSGSELLFQASGWIEPDPWPVRITVLTDGFVDQVLVKEGEAVTNGQVVARLDARDASLALQAAEAREEAAGSAVHSASNAVQAAQLQQQAAEAGVEAAAARAEEARDAWQRLVELPTQGASETERVAAERARKVSESELVLARASALRAASLVRSAMADLQTRRASLTAAGKQTEISALDLERMVVRANVDGVVLKRYVDPGSKRMAAMDDPDSATIVSLFDPHHLQVRVDVPLAEAGRLDVGLPARISSALLPGRTFEGRVTRIVGQADLQRNTLQAKVAILAPDPRLRPEVLCRVEFRGMSRADDPDTIGSGRHSLWVPLAALSGGEEVEQNIWVVDPISRKAEPRTIRLGDRHREGYRLVREGLRANESVVTRGASSLTAGRRVNTQGNGETR